MHLLLALFENSVPLMCSQVCHAYRAASARAATEQMEATLYCKLHPLLLSPLQAEAACNTCTSALSSSKGDSYLCCL